MKIKQLISLFFVFAVCQTNGLSAVQIALVSNFEDSSVTLFDTTTDTLISNVMTGNGPEGIAITPNGEKAYVINSLDNTVTVINLTTFPLTTTTLNDPSFQFNRLALIAITPDGSRAYIPSLQGHVTVINTLDDTLNTVISGLFNEPLGIAITPDGQTALVSNIVNVTKIDLATNALSLITSTDFNDCTGIAIKPDGSMAYVANQSNTNFVPIDLTTFLAGPPIDILQSTFISAINPLGTKAYLASFDVSIPVVDLVNNTLSNTILGLSITAGVAFKPDGKKAYVTDSGAGNVYPILVETDTLQPPIAGFVEPIYVAVIPDQAPTARFTFTARESGSETLFDAAASSSPDGFIQYYAWNFGDGVSTVTTSPTISHVYTTSGSFTVTLTVTNSQGTSTFQTFTGQIVSNNGGPTAITSQLINVSSPVNLAPPSNFRGIVLKKNACLKKTQNVLVAKWNASPSADVASYRVYSNGIVVKEIQATSPLVFRKCLGHSSGKGFEITAVSLGNLESRRVPIKIGRIAK